MSKELTRLQKIEQSITKKYRKELWSKFQKALFEYDMIQPGDRIAVCISGGKDSMLMAKMLQLYQRYGLADFELKYMVMDPGYNEENRKKIEENLQMLGIEAHFFTTRIFDIANNSGKSPCYLCARMRRGALYSEAKALGCNKIALGHHFNDVIETTIMAMFYSSKLETIIPKACSENFGSMELIRPMYCIKEDDILAWCRYNSLEFIRCACRFTEQNSCDNGGSKRQEAKALIKKLKETNPEVDDNIFRSLHAVQLESFPGYKKNGTVHSFLEEYQGRKSVKEDTDDEGNG